MGTPWRELEDDALMSPLFNERPRRGRGNATLERVDDAPKTFALCETVTAGPKTPNHLRDIAPGEALKLSGGVNQSALCGRDIGHGWDLRLVSGNEARSLSDAGWICSSCLEALLHRESSDGE